MIATHSFDKIKIWGDKDIKLWFKLENIESIHLIARDESIFPKKFDPKEYFKKIEKKQNEPLNRDNFYKAFNITPETVTSEQLKFIFKFYP
jgi:hypothetical protein